MGTILAAAVFALAVALVPACTSSHDEPDAPAPAAAPDSGATVTCAKDPRAETFTANLSKTSTLQKMTGTLMAGDPAPPAYGLNHWTLKVVDAQGAPITGTLTATPFMPDHGHPSQTVPTVTSKGDGVYDVDKLNFYMPGFWRVTFETDQAPGDTLVYSFCVEG